MVRRHNMREWTWERWVVAGDLNCHSVRWERSCRTASFTYQEVENIVDRGELVTIPDTPTYVPAQSTIDLMVATPGSIVEWGIWERRYVGSDHEAIGWT